MAAVLPESPDYNSRYFRRQIAAKSHLSNALGSNFDMAMECLWHS